MNDRNETLASNLRDLRSWNKLTLEQVAERIGVTRQAVAKWESGERAFLISHGINQYTGRKKPSI